MKVACTMLIILVTLFFVSGCYEEKPGTNGSKNVVRKAIEKPVGKTRAREETKKETVAVVNKDSENSGHQESLETQDIAGVANQESPETQNIDRGPNQEPEGKQVIDSEVNQETPGTQDIAGVANQESPEIKNIDRGARQEKVEKQDNPVGKINIYVTKRGDTLLAIAGKADIYNNPLKWPLLYRDNPKALSSLKGKDNFYIESLPAGIKFKITSEKEMEKNLENRPARYYVANLISSPYMKEIAPLVVKLIDAGFYAYISSTMIDGREWYRLRAGFYKTRSEANSEGDNIKKHLKIPDIWTAKANEEEYQDFGGY
jgi:hypothetical protein